MYMPAHPSAVMSCLLTAFRSLSFFFPPLAHTRSGPAYMWCGATLEFMRGRLNEIGRVREDAQCSAAADALLCAPPSLSRYCS